MFSPSRLACLRPLSPRERNVLDLLERGRTYKETAAALAMSVNTVRTRVKSILLKSGARNAREAIFARRTE